MESGEMNTEILGVALQIVLLIVISYPLGKYIAKVYKGADSECLLVCMGHGATLYTAVVAVKSGWKR